MNQSSNRTSLDTDTRWPAYQGQNSQNTEANIKTPSITFAYPDTKHPLDPPPEGHGSTEQQIHYHNRMNQQACNTPNIGTTPKQSDIDWGQRNPWEGKNLCMETPHVPQHRTGLSQSYSDISVSSTNVPMAPTNTSSAPTGLGSSSTPPISYNHGDQHTNYTPAIEKTPTQLSGRWGQEGPQEGTTQHNKNPHIPQHRIGPFQSHPGTSGSNADIQMAPLSTPSTSTKIKSPSTLTIFTPRRTRGNISPIMFPTPEPDKLPVSSTLGRDSSNLSLNLNTPRVNLTRTIIRNPHDLKVKEQNLQSEPTNVDLLPRRSYSHNSTNLSSHNSRGELKVLAFSKITKTRTINKTKDTTRKPK